MGTAGMAVSLGDLDEVPY